MYLPLVRAFNYALDRLSRFNVSGIPEFQEKRQIVFAHGYSFEGLFSPDIVLVKWNTFKWVHAREGAAYSASYESTVCCGYGYKPYLSWRNILSTLEIKRDNPGDAGDDGKGKAKQKFVNSPYTGNFGDLEGDLEMARPPKPTQSASLHMVNEGNPTRTRTSASPSSFFTFSLASVWTLPSLRNQEPLPSTSDQPPLSLGGIHGAILDPDIQRGFDPMRLRRQQEQSTKAQSAIYASHKISSYFDVSHTINLLLIGTWSHF
jgi:hypothetical protein